VSLWRNRSFTLLWSGQMLSELGGGMSALAVPLLVLAITGSPVQAGIVGTVASATRALVRLPVGVLVDRVNRKRAMLACDAVRLAALGGLAAAVANGRATLALVIAVAVIEAMAGVIFDNSESAALRNLVPLTQIPAAVARNEARTAAAGLAGPPLGGLLYGLARGLPFLADAVSYLVSFVTVAAIRDPLQQPRTAMPPRAGAALAEGVRLVLREPFLRACLWIAAPLNFGYAGLLFAIVLVLRGEGVAPALIGTVDTIVGVSALVGAILAPTLQRLMGLRTLVLGIAWTAAALVASSALLTHSVLIGVPVAVSLLFSPAANAALSGYQAALTPDRLQGRVMSVIMLVATSLAMFAPLVAGVLVDRLGGPGTVLVFAGVFAIAAVAATASRGIRAIRPIGELTAHLEA
jgi:MFS family permease